MEEKIQKARDEGDTFELSQLKDKQEQIQKDYWKARQNREGLMKPLLNNGRRLKRKFYNLKLLISKRLSLL